MSVFSSPQIDTNGRPIYDNRTKMKPRTEKTVKEMNRFPVGFSPSTTRGDTVKTQYSVRK